MTVERWQEIKGQIADSFGITKQENEDLDFPQKGSKEVIEFLGPAGRIRLEYYTRPVVLGKKTLGSKRMGSQAVVEYQYSDTEQSHELKVYRLEEGSGEWQEIKAERLFSF